MAKRINPHTGKWEDVDDATIETNAHSSVATFIPDLTDDDLRKLAREKLSEALQAVNPVEQPELTRRLCAEVKDRLDGKPGQQVTVDQTLRHITLNANIEFIPANREKLINPPEDNSTIVIDQ